MKSTMLLSRAMGFFTALKPRELARPAPSSRLVSEKLRQSLDGRLVEHLSAYAELNAQLEHGTPLDQLSESRRLMQDAKSIAEQISSIPSYDEIEPLAEAQNVLVEHWRTPWSTGGVSPVAYRSRLKGLLLFIRVQCDSQSVN